MGKTLLLPLWLSGILCLGEGTAVWKSEQAGYSVCHTSQPGTLMTDAFPNLYCRHGLKTTIVNIFALA